jgi:hypothetical protein
MRISYPHPTSARFAQKPLCYRTKLATPPCLLPQATRPFGAYQRRRRSYRLRPIGFAPGCTSLSVCLPQGRVACGAPKAKLQLRYRAAVVVGFGLRYRFGKVAFKQRAYVVPILLQLATTKRIYLYR